MCEGSGREGIGGESKEYCERDWGEKGMGVLLREVLGEGTLERGSDSLPLLRSPKRRKSNASESRCIRPDGPGCNSPVQRAKHTPFFAIREWQKILVDRQKHKTF